MLCCQAGKIPMMKATLVASLLEDTSQVARRLVQLKGIFPGANVSQLATRCPALLITVRSQPGCVLSAGVGRCLSGGPLTRWLDADSMGWSGWPALTLTGHHAAQLGQAEQNLEDLRAKAQALREAIPGVDIDKLVSQHPVEVLNVESFLVPDLPLPILWLLHAACPSIMFLH